MSKINGRILIPGGILSPGDLRKIVNTAYHFNTESLQLGNRQEILFSIDKRYAGDFLKRLSTIQYKVETGPSEFHNIVTSFPTRNIAPSTEWLSEGVYLEILSAFDYQPKLKINITDPNQSMVPLFTGDINFVASSHDNYWYLFLRLPGTQKLTQWQVLVDGAEISQLSKKLEEIWNKNNLTLPVLESYVYNSSNWNFRIIDKPFTITPSRFLNYEGFHSIGERFWLGVFVRENKYDVSFLEHISIACSDSNIGSICLTPWNSFIVKNISEKELPMWERILGKYGVNTGHSHLELNWVKPENDRISSVIKNYVFKRLEKRGLRTEGLVFSIAKSPDIFSGSILISRNSLFKIGDFEFFPNYSVRYKKDFNVNSNEIISLAEGLKRRNLTDILVYLSTMYFDELNKLQNKPFSEKNDKFKVERKITEERKVYQCQDCLTVYDPVYGDESQKVLLGTSWYNIPEHYKCPLCESSKEKFIQVKLEELPV